nr:hypothetical protein [Jidongwangia harbinensis]
MTVIVTTLSCGELKYPSQASWSAPAWALDRLLITSNVSPAPARVTNVYSPSWAASCAGRSALRPENAA